MQTENYVNETSPLDFSLLELVRYYVSAINQCAYCMDMHFKESIGAGETPQRLHSVMVYQQTDYFNQQEKALLSWANWLTKLETSGSEVDVYYQALAEHFSQTEITQLTLAITQINTWTRLAKAFGFVPGSYQLGQFS
ncbi:carboxymuconolactone decarboxylase family protein [Catenovulum sp. SM1970]|nr:carboxymuconolactone decarboxylase family protein [Marinifaba aquimaris]